MPEINNLNSIDYPQEEDFVPVYSRRNGAARKLSFWNMLAWFLDRWTATENYQNLLETAKEGAKSEARKFYTTQEVPSQDMGITVDAADKWFVMTNGADGGNDSITLDMSGYTPSGGDEFLLTTANRSATITAPGVVAPLGELTGKIELAAGDTLHLRYVEEKQRWYKV
jgi:hypothetical protein